MSVITHRAPRDAAFRRIEIAVGQCTMCFSVISAFNPDKIVWRPCSCPVGRGLSTFSCSGAQPLHLIEHPSRGGLLNTGRLAGFGRRSDMPFFDAYIMTDWSGGSRRRKNRQDAIWIAHGEIEDDSPQTESPSSRTEAIELIRALLHEWLTE